MNIKCREFQLILQMIAVEIKLTITLTNLQLETKIMHYRNVICHLLSGPEIADHAEAQGTRFRTLPYFFMSNYLQQLFYREIYWNEKKL